MHDLGEFSLRDVAECTARVRRLGHGAGSMEEAASRIVTYLYEDLSDHRNGRRACALVRFYKTHPYGLLDAGRRRFAEARFTGEPAAPGARWLTLLATTGDEPAWCSVAGSRDHQAMPFETAGDAARAPKMVRLVDQLRLAPGLDGAAPPSSRSSASAAAIDFPTGDVFLGCAPMNPAGRPLDAAFATSHRICSMLGFGGLLPGGDLFVVVLFTRVAIGAAARELFKTLALAVKVGVMSFERGPVFS